MVPFLATFPYCWKIGCWPFNKSWMTFWSDRDAFYRGKVGGKLQNNTLLITSNLTVVSLCLTAFWKVCEFLDSCYCTLSRWELLFTSSITFCLSHLDSLHFNSNCNSLQQWFFFITTALQSVVRLKIRTISWLFQTLWCVAGKIRDNWISLLAPECIAIWSGSHPWLFNSRSWI